MILKNYYAAIAAYMQNNSVTLVGTSGTSTTTTINNLGSVINFLRNKNVVTSYSNYGIILGTGTTTPTLDDYKLSGSVVTGISTSTASTITNDDDGTTTTLVITVTNSNSTSITIGEVGYLTVGQSYYLVDRTVLDSPVTIPAGGVGQVTYKIRMNYPT